MQIEKKQLQIEEEKRQEEQENNKTRKIMKKILRDVKEIQADNARVRLYQEPQNIEYQNETTTRTEFPWIKPRASFRDFSYVLHRILIDISYTLNK